MRFVASGHLHRDTRMIIDDVARAWAPGAALWSSASDRRGGAPWVGLLGFQFSGDRCSVRTREPDDMLEIDLRSGSRGPGHRDFRIAAEPFRTPII